MFNGRVGKSRLRWVQERECQFAWETHRSFISQKLGLSEAMLADILPFIYLHSERQRSMEESQTESNSKLKMVTSCDEAG